MPWAEVQSRLLALQRSGGLCVQPRPLTELDVHHRILRYTNYQVALANKGLLPARCALPWGGSLAFLSRGLALNVDLLLFRGPFSLFRGGWELPDAYKRHEQRGALAARWRRTVLLLAAANLALSPLVLAWQVLHAFYSHAELLRREPGALGARRWARLARLQLRHFNELPHELRARLARAYRPAAAFLRAAAPPAPLLALLARQLVFFAGAPLAALLLLTVYDEDVLAVEHVLTAMTALGVTATVARCDGSCPGGRGALLRFGTESPLPAPSPASPGAQPPNPRRLSRPDPALQVLHSGGAVPGALSAAPAAGRLGPHALPPRGARGRRQGQRLPADGAAVAIPSGEGPGPSGAAPLGSCAAGLVWDRGPWGWRPGECLAWSFPALGRIPGGRLVVVTLSNPFLTPTSSPGLPLGGAPVPSPHATVPALLVLPSCPGNY